MDLAITKRLWADMDLIKDPFSKELIDLWQSREMSGLIFSLHEDVRTMTPTLGYILLELKGSKATIRGFWVDKRYRGKGHGSELLKAVKGYCLVQDCSELHVNITESEENIKLYEKMGFRMISRRTDYPDQIHAIFYNRKAEA